MTEQVNQDLGADLRRAREQSGLTLRHIADTTKLSVRTLEALENNRIGKLPGGIYRRAIVRAYAAEVGLDVEQTVRAFVALHPDDVPSMAKLIPAQTPPPPSRVRRALVGLLGAVLPIFAAILYFYFTSAASRPVAGPASDLLAPEAAVSDVAHAASVDASEPLPMTVRVSAPTHLQIVADGLEVIGRAVRAGELIRLELVSDVVLIGDDAGAVHFSINGRAGRTLGDDGTPLAARIARDAYDTWLIQP